MTKDTMKEAATAAEVLVFDDWFDAIEDGVCVRARGIIEGMPEEELSCALPRPSDGRRKPGEEKAASLVVVIRHGRRERPLTGAFGKTRIAAPCARLMGEESKTHEWRSAALPAYQRRTRRASPERRRRTAANLSPKCVASGAARQNGLAKALREIGRLERTLFSLDGMKNRALRRPARRFACDSLLNLYYAMSARNYLKIRQNSSLNVLSPPRLIIKRW
jgi:hypothetical protein